MDKPSPPRADYAWGHLYYPVRQVNVEKGRGRIVDHKGRWLTRAAGFRPPPPPEEKP